MKQKYIVFVSHSLDLQRPDQTIVKSYIKVDDLDLKNLEIRHYSFAFYFVEREISTVPGFVVQQEDVLLSKKYLVDAEEIKEENLWYMVQNDYFKNIPKDFPKVFFDDKMEEIKFILNPDLFVLSNDGYLEHFKKEEVEFFALKA